MATARKPFVLLQQLIKTYPIFDPSTSALVLRHLVDYQDPSHDPRPAALYLHHMLRRGLTPHPATFNRLLRRLLLDADLLHTASSLFREARTRMPLDEHSFAVMIRGLCDAGLFDEASILLDEFEAGAEASSVVIYTSLIDGCCKRGSFDAAKRLFDRMKGRGVSPNEFTYTVMISGCFRNGFPTSGFEMYEEMKQSGVCPNLYTYNVLISECCRGQDFCLAFQLFDEMSQKGILPNIVTYNTLIGGFCKQSKGSVRKLQV
ncbi:pentatricopeptide repeat-containing protein At4g11690-like isoform X2 [Zingiber officinale]|uniref:pentatricopeptide repeat-containing protein At4g11690-like isoform X2 n=1 Tax=Zingiber officinale TaxID=94328 RepID=UPI001C4ADCFA|nr:pentatricopeptide repeat-containing protein At4g11690-like isoform X2 [Zingiber officinale]